MEKVSWISTIWDTSASNSSTATVSNNLWKSFTQLEDMELRLLAGKNSINSSKEKSTEEEFFDCFGIYK